MAIPLITGLAFIFIYVLFAQNREDQFQKRQKDKVVFTLKILSEIKESEEGLIESLDRLTINDLLNEKLLLFNSEKKLIYSNIDDTPLAISGQILSELNPENNWVETKDGDYDVIGTYIESFGHTYYGISKAYDTFGYSKLTFLKYILSFTFIVITILVVLVSSYMARKITQTLVAVTDKIRAYDFEKSQEAIQPNESRNEVAILNSQFDKLMQKVAEVYSFQKHAIHHISHELKTPIAILVSNLERMEKVDDIHLLKPMILEQKEDTKSLGQIINTLLELAKVESENNITFEQFRIDELIFDIADELRHLYPNFQFSINYAIDIDENKLLFLGNKRLMKAALSNLMVNSIQYNSETTTKIELKTRENQLIIMLENVGPIIETFEEQWLFKHFFRGQNGKTTRGFGIGLVFVQKIIALHFGEVSYAAIDSTINQFKITLPLT